MGSPGAHLGVRHKDRVSKVWTEGDVGYVFMNGKNGTCTATFDAWRFAEVDRQAWNVSKAGYVQTTLYDPSTQKRSAAAMQVYLFPGCPKGLVRDHINRNKLDNREENIRFVSPSTNCFNRGRLSKPGVSYMKRSGKYQASLVIGLYDTEEEAYAAFLDAWPKVRGELPEFVDV